MNAETLAALELDDSISAALERVGRCAEALAGQHESAHFQACLADDLAILRAHITDLQNGGERAKVVAWLRAGQAAGDDLDNHAYGWAADAIEAGAHLGGEDADG